MQRHLNFYSIGDKDIMIKRPLIWFSIAFAIGCAFALFSLIIPFTVLAVIITAAILGGKFVPKLLPVCILTAGIACGIGYTTIYHTWITEPIADLAGMSKRMDVTAIGYAAQYDDSQRIAVRVNGKEAGCRINFRTLVYLPLTEQEIQPGDIITGKLEFYISGIREGFDKESYYRSQGYPVLASVNNESSIQIKTPEHRPFSYYPKRFAYELRSVFMKNGSERQFAFWSALTTGDRSSLTTTDTDHLRRAGLSHIIALSGLHVGFLISFLLFVFGKRVGTAAGIPILIAFYLMVGWSPSVVRACIMYGILLLSFWLRQQSDSLNSLFVALIVILIFLPDALMSVSLQLSFTSTLGILCFATRAQNLLALPKNIPFIFKRVYQTLLGSAICSICSTAVTAPILIYHFGYLSVFSIFSNLLALWAVSLLFPVLAIGGIAGMISAPAAAYILIPAKWLTNYLYWVSDTIANIPYGVLYYENKIDLCVAVILSIITVLLLWKAGKRMLITALPALVVVLIGISVWRGVSDENDLNISILPEGSGQAIVVCCDRKAVLIDCSGSGYHNAAQDVAQYLDWHGIDGLDCMILTSVDKTHARNACELLHTVSVNQVIMPEKIYEDREPYPALIQAIEQLGVPYERTAPKEETQITDSTFGLSILGTAERKLAVRIQSEDQNILIVHALTQNMLLELTEQVKLSCDTLIVSGGFSKDSDKMQEILNRIAPKQIVLESGWKSGSDYNTIPILNPYYIGQIDWKTIRD